MCIFVTKIYFCQVFFFFRQVSEKKVSQEYDRNMRLQEDNIITVLYRQGHISDICGAYCKDSELCKDLVQEVTVILLAMKPEKVQTLNKKGELLKYITGIVHKQFISTKSDFYNKYMKFSNKSKELNDGNQK